MAEKKKFPVKTSLRGALVFPHLNVADSKFTKPGNLPDYRTKLRVGEVEFVNSGWKAFLDEQAEAALDTATDQEGQPLNALNRKKAKDKGLVVPYSRALDKDGNELPYYDVNFKITEGGIDRKTGERYSNKPKQFDSSLPPKPISVELRNGAEVKISYTIFPWATAALGYGVSLRPKAVQVLKLAPKGEADAAYYGFDGDEEGYQAEADGSEDFTASSDGDSGYKAPAEGFDTDDIPF